MFFKKYNMISLTPSTSLFSRHSLNCSGAWAMVLCIEDIKTRVCATWVFKTGRNRNFRKTCLSYFSAWWSTSRDWWLLGMEDGRWFGKSHRMHHQLGFHQSFWWEWQELGTQAGDQYGVNFSFLFSFIKLNRTKLFLHCVCVCVCHICITICTWRCNSQFFSSTKWLLRSNSGCKTLLNLDLLRQIAKPRNFFGGGDWFYFRHLKFDVL